MVALTRESSSGPPVCVFDGALLPGGRGVAEPCQRPDFSLQVWLADKLGAAVEGDRFSRQVWEITHRFYDLPHDSPFSLSEKVLRCPQEYR